MAIYSGCLGPPNAALQVLESLAASLNGNIKGEDEDEQNDLKSSSKTANSSSNSFLLVPHSNHKYNES